MMFRSLGFVAAAVFGAVTIVSGCDCARTGQTNKSFGEIGVVWIDAQQNVVTSRDATYEFGTVAVGDSVTKKMVVKNLGTGQLILTSLEYLEGDGVNIADATMDNASFDVRFVRDTTLGASESAEFDITFHPVPAPTRAHSVKLLLRAAGTREGEETATITLTGEATSDTCALPNTIDFGKVALGATGTQTITFSNTSAAATNAFFGQIAGVDAASFKYAPGQTIGEVALQPGASRELVFEFRPTELRAYEAKVNLRAASTCPAKDVTLTGLGVDTVLEWTPASLDFLFVQPGSSANRQVVFKNYGSSDIELFNVQSSLPSDFAVKADTGQDPTKFVVPAQGERAMNVVCSPSQLGLREGTLTFNTPLTKTPQGAIPLTCFGGGPDIQVIPSGTLNFGKVAYFPSANPPTSVVRRITVMNVGSTPPDANPDANLRLGQVSPSGEPGQLPLIKLTPTNGNTAADEFSVSFPPSYDPAVGLQAKAGANLMDLAVTLTPKTLGAKQAELIIYSNDPDEPETKITLAADAVQLPPCDYSVTPASVNFGLVTPGTYREVPITFHNNGVNPGDVCLISGVDLMPGTDPAYSMVGGAIPSKELQSGESFQALIRVEPQGQVPNAVVNLTGTLQYFASSPTRPSGTVPLSTAVGPSCLTIAPAHEDFGAVKPGCSSTTRTFNIYNICSSAVMLDQISVREGAGQQPGGPNCPGTSPCPEFFLTSTPPIPTGGLSIPSGGTPVTFQAKYKAIDVGSDSGVIAVDVHQTGLPVTYLVTLAGKGDPAGQNTDIFTQDAQPKADLLLTIDNSGSMEPYQTSLANNFASFIQYATSANVDWHIGVTTTDMDDGEPPITLPGLPPIPGIPPGDKGRLRGDANNPKVLTPTTPNVVQLFKDKVKVGTNGSATETGLAPSLAALTPPLSVGENAGFLRPDANLAVVVITDAPDQSGQPASYYVNSFLNIKGFNRANMFTFNAIAGFAPTPPQGCAGYDGGPDDGTYAFVVAQTNGVKDEICTQNWAATLQGLGKTAFGFRTTFFLNSTPDVNQPITVKVNGVPVPPTQGAQTNWAYDSATNAIVFNQQTAPGPGESLEITYFVGCLP
ncbi:MAG: choice-of-anchor D domain-containing protein [Myxococcaceae bacterium]|nr:choice-of-anchor D domain-containing protein [Myxococcaceae bacterium]